VTGLFSNPMFDTREMGLEKETNFFFPDASIIRRPYSTIFFGEYGAIAPI
jgi:hypothetical protein